MGKTVGVGSTTHRPVEMKGALGKHIGRYLDQYTFICVFGSVVGYAVMPLIGTIETLVFSVIVIGLSINTVLRKTASKDKDERRRASREDKRAKRNESKKSAQVQVITDSETKRQRDELRKSPKDLKTLADEEEAEKERRLEEKREKKARKKEERIKRREEEKKEKEREEVARRERQEQRALKKQQEKDAKEKARGYLFPTYETIKAMVSTHKPVRRERKHSTSSSTSSGSSTTHSHRSHPHSLVKDHHQPVRASSDPLIYSSNGTSHHPTYNQEHLPWNSKNADSTNLSFPHLPTSNKPWSAPGHPLPTSTPGTTHTNISHRFETPKSPMYAQTSFLDVRGNVLCEQPNLNRPVETLTPGYEWRPSFNKQFNNTLPFLDAGSSGCHGNPQPSYAPAVFKDGKSDPLVSSNGSFYSLFSDGVSSPFMNFLPKSNDYSGQHPSVGSDCKFHPSSSEHRSHSNNRGNRSVEKSLAVSRDGKSSSESVHAEIKGYDEWPNI